MKRWMVFVAAIAVMAPGAGAQQNQRRATMVGGGDRDRGKCTIEVVVDGAADIEVRGDQGTIRNLSGQPAQWRRFECTGAMPANAADFHFSGVDGRGRQQLIKDPRNGGAAVVRIEDAQGGSEGYTFDLTWGGSNGNNPGGYTNSGPAQRVPPDDRQGGQFRRFSTEQAVGACQNSVRQQALTRFRGRSVEFRETRIDDNPGRSDWVIGTLDVLRGPNAPEEQLRFSCSVNFDNGQVRSVDLQPMGPGWIRQGGGGQGGIGQGGMGQGGQVQGGQGRRFTTEQALGVCQDYVRQQARTRYRGRSVEFRETRMDDNPGRNDWVIGLVDVLGGANAPEEHLRFSCSVNFDNGQVRSMQLDPMGAGYRQGNGDRVAAQRALATCQQAVKTRVQRDGYDRIEFESIRLDDQPGREDWVIGSVRADRGRGSESLSFSCSVNLRDGDVRSVDVTRR